MELVRDADAKVTGSWFGFRKDPETAIQLYHRAAKEFAAKNEWEEAGKAWVKAAEVEHSRGGSMLSAMTNASIAFHQAMNGEQFKNCLEVLLNIYILSEQWERVGDTFEQIGEFYKDRSNFEKASEAFEKAYAHFKMVKMNKKELRCVKQLAKTLSLSKKYKEARAIWTKLSGKEAEFGGILCYMMTTNLDKVKETISFQVKEKELLSILVRAIETKNFQLFKTAPEAYYLEEWQVVILREIGEKYFN